MYYIKDNNLDMDELRKYGFRLGREWPEYTTWICNVSDYDDFWLVSTFKEVDEPEVIGYAEEPVPIWSIHVQPINFDDIPYKYRLWIDASPCCTYHICIFDMEPMFSSLFKMIEDGLLFDKLPE